MKKANEWDIKGKVCLITGGARGMGRLWAEQFGRDKASLVLWDLDRQGLEETAAQLREAGCSVSIDQVDVTSLKAIQAGAQRIREQLGPVDILVNNAGVVYAGPFLQTDLNKLGLTIDVNLKAMLWMNRVFLEDMVAQGSGLVVNVASASAFVGVPLMPAYTASKWGVVGLSESLRLEMKMLGHEGIQFSVFCPSYVDTGMFKGVTAPRLVPLLTPQEAVERGYRAIQKGVFLIKEPFMVKFTPTLKALLPAPIFDRISNVLGVTTSMTTWKGRDE